MPLDSTPFFFVSFSCRFEIPRERTDFKGYEIARDEPLNENVVDVFILDHWHVGRIQQ